MLRPTTLWLAPAAVIAVMLLAPADALADGRRDHDRGRDRGHDRDRHRDRDDDRAAVRGRITISTGNASITLGGHYRDGDRHRGHRGHHFHRGHGRYHHVHPRLHRYRPPVIHHRVWVPGHYETRTAQLLIEPGHYTYRDVPPVYETRYRHGRPVRVLVREGYRERIWAPARYETRHTQVWVPGYWKTVTTRPGW